MPWQQCGVHSTLLRQAVHLVMHAQYICQVRQLVATRTIHSQKTITNLWSQKTKSSHTLQTSYVKAVCDYKCTKHNIKSLDHL